MKKVMFTLITVGLMLTCSFAGEEISKWNRFSENIKLALNGENPGVKLSALKLIIRFNDKLNSSDHFYNVATAFNNSDNLEIRKAALIAMYKLDRDKAVDFFEVQQELEEDEAIKGKMAAIISAYQKDIILANTEVDKSFEVCRCCLFLSLTY